MLGLLLIAIGAHPATTEAQTVRGLVLDRLSGTVVGAVLVHVVNQAGDTVATTYSDESGKFVLSAPVGIHRLHLRRIGYRDERRVIGATDAEGGVLVIGMTPTPVELESLDAWGNARAPYLNEIGFYRRRAFGFGYFMDRAEIEAAAVGGRALYLLQGLPGVRVVGVADGSGDVDVVMRGGSCFPSIVVDWNVVRRGGSESTDIEILPHPDNIEGIEVYPGPAGIPPRARSGSVACGAILIWTRK